MSTLVYQKSPGHPVVFFDARSTTGDVFFVDSGVGTDGTGEGRSPDKPFASIDYAIGQCTANNGDTIYVMPGHAETVSAAAGIDFDVAGVSCIGIGYGTDRPTVTLDTATAADVDVAAANILIENIVFDLTGVDAIVAGIDVDAAFFTMRRCRVVMADSGGQAVLGILTDANADNMTIEDCEFVGSSDAGAAAAIRLVGCDEATIRRCKFTGDYSVGNISFLTTAPTNVLIEENDFNNLNTVDVNVEGLAASTGTLRWNTCRIVTDAQTTWLNTLGALQLYENYGVNADGETGKLIGTASV